MLSADRWKIVEELFHEALDLPAGERAAFLEAKRGGDDEIRREVESLLAAESGESGDGDPRALLGVAGAVAAEWAGRPAAPSLEGRTIHGYKILSLIGAGGMGEVYLGEDVELGRRVALKLLPEAFSADPGRIDRFIDEARAASSLNHPNILTIFRVDQVDGRRVIVSEYIDGDTLRDRLTQGPLPPETALDIALQVAAALQAAHDAGLVHRDIKPENIMIRRDGYVKVLDFGLAKLTRASGVGARRAMTRTGAVLGTAEYMAPEQASGGTVDARADVYGLSVVLHEMLTGVLPRESAGRQQRSIAAFERLLRRGLATDPSSRYPNVAAMRRDLEALRGGGTRVPVRWIVAAAVVAAAIAGAWWWRALSTSSREIHSLIVMPLQSLGGDPGQSHLEAGLADAVATRLAGLPRLRVPPSAAVKANEDPFDAARRLGADAVLTGSVQRAGDQLRVTVQLARTADRAQIWASRFDERFTDIFAVEDTIAERIAGNLATPLTTNDRAALSRRETRNADAYDLYLRAREQWSRRTPESIRTAIRMYQDAIALDPDFALAYSGMADCYNIAVSGLTPAVRHPLARAAAERAVALDAQSGAAHNSLAFMRYKFEWRWADAEREFARAIELEPRYVLARHWYGEYLGLMGRFPESIDQYRKALELDPLSTPIRVDFLPVLAFAGRIDEGHAVIEEGLRNDPDSGRMVNAAAYIYAVEGRDADALESNLRGQLLLGVPQADVDAQRQAYRAGGRRALQRQGVDALLAQLKRGSPLTPGIGLSTRLSLGYADLGDREGTLKWLAKSIELGEDGPLHMKLPTYDFVRDDPRFTALLEKVGLQ